MKYLTKEFFTLEVDRKSTRLNSSHIRQSKRAEQKDERFYKRIYKKIYAVFEKFSKSCDRYHDTEED